MEKQRQFENYDLEPVKYCGQCLSLKIQYEEIVDTECCGECGCTNIMEGPIEVWEKKYEEKYGHKFVSGTGDIRKSPLFKMSFTKLMHKVSESSKWKVIISSLYPHFPKGLGKTDSIILLFDKLVKDNKLDNLRMLLYKMHF